jgi:alanine racemase
MREIVSLQSSAFVSIRPTRVEVDLDALAANAALLRQLAGAPVYAVVKADAYGHGAPDVARALARSPAVAGFAVSLVEEGTQLRDAGITGPILVMGPALDGGHAELVGRGMTAMVSDANDLERLGEIGWSRGRAVEVHLKVDTGMGRLGVPLAELEPLLARLGRRGGAIVTGLATHFACADSDDPTDEDCMTYAQLRAFDEAVAIARRAGAAPRVLHTANSSGAILFPAARKDLVRTGIALYGNGVERWRRREPAVDDLRQAMRLVSRVMQLRTVRAGGTVGYGALWKAERDSSVAVLPIGYADGLPRRLTGRGEVLIRGRRCPLVGAISMDIAIADVTDVPAVGVGDEAVLLGAQGAERIGTAEVAERSGLTEYEVTCGMSKRVPRVHLEPATATAASAAGGTP